MKNSIGTNVILTIFGESHGPAVGAVLDGLPPGIPVREDFIARCLSERRPSGPAATSRREKDEFTILSGTFKGFTTGAPLCITIPNKDVDSAPYECLHGLARPSHADYTAHVKYRGYEDYRGGGHFSGRVTAALTAVGAIALTALELKDIHLDTRILSVGGIPAKQGRGEDADFPASAGRTEKELSAVAENAAAACDSAGGVLQTVVSGMPAGVGEPWFDSLEGMISRAVFAVGGVKGIEFGAGFGLAGMRGSEANDAFYHGDDGRVLTRTNNNGGINGGISNGMPIVFNTAVKPTPSIAREQQTINMLDGTDTTIRIPGRHDSAIVLRIGPVITAMTAIVICDTLGSRLWP